MQNKHDFITNKRSKSAAVNQSRDLNTDDGLIQQLVAEIGSIRPRLQKEVPQVKTIESRPRKYYFTELSDQDEVQTAEAITSSKNITKIQVVAAGAPVDNLREHDLYSKVAEFLWIEYESALYPMRIDEKRSSNTRGPNGNRWLYPDLVAMEDLSADWNREVKDCVQQYADKKTRIWAFEVKLLINRSNVREAYFQAVSNSSWANLGYLVSSEIEGADTGKELRMLSALHGIGVIRLDVTNPSESQILIPARERTEVDWATANRLAIENRDFLEFVRKIKEFYQTGNPRKTEWDLVKGIEKRELSNF
jgi:uncharacterized protein